MRLKPWAAAALVLVTTFACLPPTSFEASGTAVDPDPALLPLVEVPATVPGRTLALLISGDGNWAAADRGIAKALAAHGVAVVGLEARRYLTRARTPDEVSRDVEALLRAYLSRWDREQIVLIGYSRGAGMVPFVANRLSPELRDRTRLVALLGPTESASFEFHAMDLVRNTRRATDLPLLPEVERLSWTEVLCVYGEGESDSLCRTAPPELMRVVPRAGGHRIRSTEPVAETLLGALGLR